MQTKVKKVLNQRLVIQYNATRTYLEPYDALDSPPRHLGALIRAVSTQSPTASQFVHGIEITVHKQGFLVAVITRSHTGGPFVGEPGLHARHRIPQGNQIECNVFAPAGVKVRVHHIGGVQRQVPGQHPHAIVAIVVLEAQITSHGRTSGLADVDKANARVVGDILHRG